MTKEEKERAIFNEYLNLAKAGIHALKSFDLHYLEIAKAVTYANISIIAATPVNGDGK